MKVALYTFKCYDKVSDEWVYIRKCPYSWVMQLIDQFVEYNRSLESPRYVNIEYYQ